MPRNDNQKSIETPGRKACVFCNSTDDNELKFGKIYEHDGLVTHYYCLLLSSNMEQKGEDEDGILGFLAEDILKELKRGKRLACVYCKKIGATLGCCNTKCKRIFHYPCGLKSGSLHQFFGEFRSYCVSHRPRYKPEDRFRASLDDDDDDLVATPENSTCYICLDAVNRADKFQTLWAPCCKKNAWFHRDCVQQLAMSAGYFFKCPLCNNKKEFQKAMLDRGIFIPCQDASWELVPNAFEELLYRHNRCDAKVCRCPKGRSYSNSNAKWELILCRTCGSQGIHVSCGKLKWLNPMWDCNECSSILNGNEDDDDEDDDDDGGGGEDETIGENSSSNSMDSSSSNSMCSTNVNAKDMSDDGSDSDISVGVELPIFSPSKNDSPVKIRPGPRSFKLKQQEIISRNTSFSSEGCSNSDFIGTRPETSDESDLDEALQEEKSRKIIEDIILLDSDDESEIKKTIQLSSIDNHPLSIKSIPTLIDKIPSIENNNIVDRGIKSPGNLGDTPIIVEKDPTESEDVNVCDDLPETTESDSPLKDPVDVEPPPEVPVIPEPSIKVPEATLDLNKLTPIEKIHQLIPETSVVNKLIESPAKITLVEKSTSLPAVPQDATVGEKDVPLMNIVISNVTSLPPEVFDWGPKTSITTPKISENIKDSEKNEQSREEPRQIYSPITEDITQDITPPLEEIPGCVKEIVKSPVNQDKTVLNQSSKPQVPSQVNNKIHEQSNDENKKKESQMQPKVVESIVIEDDDEIIDVEAIDADDQPKITQVVPGVIQNISIKSKGKASKSDINSETSLDDSKVNKNIKNGITINSSLKRKLNEEEPETILPCSSTDDTLQPMETLMTKKRKTNYPSYIHPIKYNKTSASIYKNGVSLNNAAVVNVMGNNFVLPLDVQKNSMSGKSSSKNSNYDGDAGTPSDAGTGTTSRGINGLGNNCQLSTKDNDCIGQNDVFPTTISSPETDSSTARLMKEKVMLKNLKFHVGPENGLKIIVSDTYTININLENVSKKNKSNSTNSSRYSDKSWLARDGPSSFIKSSSPSLNQINIPPSLNLTDKYQQCKYENDENLAPPAIATTENNLSVGKKNKRLRDSSNNSTNSDDGSYSIVANKKQKSIIQKNIQKSKKNDGNNYQSSNNENNEKFHFKVSIELSKISSFVELNPHIFQKDFKCLQKKKSLIRRKSESNLLLHEHTVKNPLRRTKSLESISSNFKPMKIVNNRNSRNINSIESQKCGKRKKIRGFEKHDCVR